MKKLMLIVVAMLVIAAPAYADLAGAVVAGSDNFNSYTSNAALAGQGNWTGNATADRIGVFNGEVKLVDVNPNAGVSDAWTLTTPYAGQNGKIWFRFQAKNGTGTEYENFVEVYAKDTAGVEFGRWQAQISYARGRVGSITTSTGLPVTETAGYGAYGTGYGTLEMLIDTTLNTTQFFVNGTSLGTLSHTAGDTLGSISFNVSRGGTHDVWFDNVAYGTVTAVPEPGSILALCSGLIGIVGFARRRRA